MRTYWGTLAGLVLGVLGGPYTAVFGALLGFLLDMVLVEFRVGRAALGFLDSGASSAWFPRPVALGAALYGHLARRLPVAFPGSLGAPSGVLTDRLRSIHPNRLSRRSVERVIAVAAAGEWPGAERFTRLIVVSTTVGERESVFSAVWATLETAGATPPARAEARELARLAGLDEGFVARELVVRAVLDADACRVLGLLPDASPAEVRAAYRRLAAQFHPDTAAGLSEEQRQATEQAFKRIQAAYDRVREV